MKIALLSDIHSNAFALESVLKDANSLGFDELWLLGDMFGYYPWAARTFELIHPLLHRTRAILGNHDLLLFLSEAPFPRPSYWEAAVQNHAELESQTPEALLWLTTLHLETRFELDGRDFFFCHGTPDDPENGRFYPDDSSKFQWFPEKNGFLLLGHTHYPLIRQIPDGGIIVNPGSVGQPRDGLPASAWGILDTESGHYLPQRTAYDHLACMALLKEINWEPRSIAVLNKLRPGKFEM